MTPSKATEAKQDHSDASGNTEGASASPGAQSAYTAQHKTRAVLLWAQTATGGTLIARLDGKPLHIPQISALVFYFTKITREIAKMKKQAAKGDSRQGRVCSKVPRPSCIQGVLRKYEEEGNGERPNMGRSGNSRIGERSSGRFSKTKGNPGSSRRWRVHNMQLAEMKQV